jgi:hypothetical protein
MNQNPDRDNLPLSKRTIFLDVNGVRAARGISADRVNELVEAGKLLWVFNLGRDEKSIRHLRFLAREVANPSGWSSVQLPEVIAQILPVSRRSFSSAEIAQWFLVSRPTACRLGSELGALKNRAWQIERPPLAAYLESQWVGATAKAAGKGFSA